MIIALDIDGTVTDDPVKMPRAVCEVLERLSSQGFTLIFLTGRPLGWGVRPLLQLSVPYYVAAINGAELVKMPEKALLYERGLYIEDYATLDALYEGEESDYVLYGGFSQQDRCFYRPHRFKPALLDYLQWRYRYLGEPWVAVKTFDDLPVKTFASLKSFGMAAACRHMAHRVMRTLECSASVIRDPFREGSSVLQATAMDKGAALKLFMRETGLSSPIIAAGDDYNDISLLQAADIKIAMATAPEEVLNLADIIAPPAALEGLKYALIQAVGQLGLT